MVRSTGLAVTLALFPVLAASVPAFAETATPQAVASEPAPENLAIARSIVTIMFPPERRQQMMDKIMNRVVAQMGSGMGLDNIADPGLHKILSDYLASVPDMLRPATSAFLPKQMDSIATAYARMFTLQQLTDIRTFAQTPSGAVYFQRNTDVLSDPAVAKVNTEYFRQATAIAQEGAAKLKEQITAYLKAHPEAMPKQAAGK